MVATAPGSPWRSSVNVTSSRFVQERNDISQASRTPGVSVTVFRFSQKANAFAKIIHLTPSAIVGQKDSKPECIKAQSSIVRNWEGKRNVLSDVQPSKAF